MALNIKSYVWPYWSGPLLQKHHSVLLQPLYSPSHTLLFIFQYPDHTSSSPYPTESCFGNLLTHSVSSSWRSHLPSGLPWCSLWLVSRLELYLASSIPEAQLNLFIQHLYQEAYLFTLYFYYLHNRWAEGGTERLLVQSLGWEDPPEKGRATHSSILAWRIPWTEEPGGL